MKNTGASSGRRFALAVISIAATFALGTLLAGVASGSPLDGSTAPTIGSDQPDYSPGATVTLTGLNWQPGEVVNIVVNDDEGQTWRRDVDVTADDSGTITDTFSLPTSFVALYSVTATGPISGTATSSFTDGNVKLHASPAGTTYTATVTSFSGSTNCSTGGGTPFSVTGVDSGGKNIAGGANVGDSLRVQAPATSDQSTSFVNWTSSDPFTNLGGGAICVPGFSGGGTRDYTANYSANVAPVVTAPANQSSNEGASASFALGSFSDSGPSPWAVDVNWGDASSHTTFSAAAAGSLGSQSHTYADGPASRTVTVTVTDNNGAGLSGSASFTVTVNNVAPTATFNAPASVNEGSNINLSLTSPSDPSSADTTAGFTYAFDCGSGYGAFGASNSTSCATSDNGSPTVKGKIQDKDGGVTEYTASVTINNVAPTAIFNAPSSVNEGSNINLSLTSPSDVSSVDTAAGFTYAFDCGSGYGAFGAANSTSCATTDNGSRTVKGKIKDKDGGETEYTASVTINSVSPIATLSNNGPVDEGSPATVSFSGQFDPSPADTSAGFHYAFSCSNGSLAGATYAGSGASASTSCTFDDGPSSNTVRARIIDKDNAFTEYTTSVSVNNVAPSATFNAPSSVNEGSNINISLTSPSDVSSADTTAGFTYAFDCGSGYGAFGAANSTSCATTDNGSRTVKGKIKDKDGGVSEYTASVNVTNVDPTATLSNNGPVNEGSPATVSFSGPFDPSSADTSAGFHYAFSCSNGSLAGATYAGSGTSASTTCTFNDNGTSTVRARIIDKDGGFSEYTTDVTVSNVAPTASLSNDGPVDEGSPATVSFSGQSDPSGADTSAGFRYNYHCDGSAFGAPNYSTADPSDSHACTFSDNGTYTVRARILDKDGGFSEYTTDVTVTNVAPVVSPAADQTATEGTAKSFSLGSFTDPGTDSPWSVDVNWGDGSSHSSFTEASAGPISAHSHTYDDNGVYTVEVTVSDGDGGSDSASFSVTVSNVAPTASLSNDGPVDEGSPATVSFSGQSDPSGADTSAGFRYNYHCDGSAFGAPNYSTADPSDSHACTFSDNGTYTVRARILDKDGGFSEYTTDVTVTNVAPVVSAGNDTTIDEGSGISRDGSFTDPGADTWTATVNYGNGSGTNSLALNPDKSFHLAHTYADDGSYTVTVKVTDDDGDTGTGTFSVTVTNVAPVVSPAADQTATEGTAKSFSLGSFTDPGTDSPWSVDVNWGDGSSHSSFTEASAGPISAHSHTYDDNGVYTVEVTVSDGDGGSDSASFSVTVSNVAPTASLSNDGPVDEGSPATVSFSGQSDPAGADTSAGFRYNYHCDGSAFGAPNYSTADPSDSHACTFSDNGTYTVRARILDKDGGFSEYTTDVTVTNVAPVVSPAADQTATEGTAKSFSLGSFTDPGTDSPWSVDVNWGDGSSHSSFTEASAGPISAHSHTYDDNGVYTVEVTVSDGDGGSDSASFSVTVSNVAPTASLSNDGPVDEGSPATVSFSGQSDPSGADTSAGFRYNYHCDGSAFGAPNYSTADPSDSHACTFSDNGTYTVRARILDKDGGFSEYTTDVTVSNVAPVVSAGNDTTIDEGSGISRDGSFTDPGADTWTATVNYGDGSGTNSLALNPDKSFHLAHTYADDGSYTVTVKVTDDDGDTGTGTFSVTVTNVAPVVSPAADQTATEGTAKSFSLGSFTDPGTDSPWSVDVNWGDGSSHSSFTEASAGPISAHSHTYDDNGVYTVEVTVSDGDGGSDSASFSVTVSNVAPVVSAGNDTTIDEGSGISRDGSFTDPGADTWTATVNYGDGSGTNSLALNPDKSFHLAHTYADDGSYTVTVKVTDDDGDTGTGTFSVTVTNVAPVVSPAADQTATEGTAKSFSLGSFTDPGTDSPWSVDVNWGDGSSHSSFTEASAGPISAHSHTYDDNGVYTVEVTVSDGDGGSDSASFSVTVSNVAPTASLSNDGPVDEGSPATVSFSGQSDPSGADTSAGFHYAYSCSNGSLAGATYAGSGTSASHSCTFSDNGTYTVRARILDKDGGFSEYTTDVTVTNVAPTANLSNNGPVDEGSPATVSFSGQSDPSGADTSAGFHYAYSCSNGSLAGATYAGSGSSSSSSCTFDDGLSTHTVRARIIDKDGGYSEYTTDVTVKNVAPTATFNAPGSVNEGNSFNLSLTSPSDQSAADTTAGFTYAFDCGSGYGAFGAANSTSCSTDDSGSRTVRGKIKDKDGGVSEYTATVTVNNVPPTATLSNNGPVDEGSPATVSFSGQSDPSSVDTAAGFHYAYSCTNGSLSGATYAGSGTSASTTCTFNDNGTYTVRARIIDKDGGYSEYTTSVVVQNVAPAVTAPADQSADEGTAKSFNLGSFSDPGSSDNPWAVDVDWGDGSAHTTFNMSTTGTITAQSHTYAEGPATKTVTVTVTDKDGGTNSRTFKVTVNNVAPAITSATFANSSVGCGTNNATLNVTFTDPGADTWNASIDWGDGTPAQQLTNVSKTFSANHTYASAGVYTAKVTVTDDDGGSSGQVAATTSLTVNYVLSNMLQPVNPGPPNSIFKWGSTIPVKVIVQDCNGAYPGTLDLRVTFAKLSGSIPQGEQEAVSTNQPDSGNQMRFTGNQYIFNLATKSLGNDSSATYRLYVTITSTGQRVQADIGTKP